MIMEVAECMAGLVLMPLRHGKLRPIYLQCVRLPAMHSTATKKMPSNACLQANCRIPFYFVGFCNNGVGVGSTCQRMRTLVAIVGRTAQVNFLLQNPSGRTQNQCASQNLCKDCLVSRKARDCAKLMSQRFL